MQAHFVKVQGLFHDKTYMYLEIQGHGWLIVQICVVVRRTVVGCD